MIHELSPQSTPDTVRYVIGETQEEVEAINTAINDALAQVISNYSASQYSEVKYSEGHGYYLFIEIDYLQTWVPDLLATLTYYTTEWMQQNGWF
jgi:hypothetical protein